MEAKSNNKQLQGHLRLALYIAAFVTAHLALATVAVRLLTTGMDRYHWPRWQSVFVEGVALSQVGLVAVWLAVGSTGVALRIAASTLVTGLWLAILNYAGLDHEYWLPLLVLLTVANAGGLFVLAQTWTFHVENQRSLQKRQPNANRGFTLRQTFAWTTAVSALLAFGTLAQQFAAVQTPPEAFPRAMIMGFMLVPVTLTATWATLGTNRRVLASVVLLLAAVAASLSIGRYDELVRRTRWSSLDWMAYARAYWYLTYLYSIFVVVSLLVTRWCGYRLVQSREDTVSRVSSQVRGSSQTLIIAGGVVLLALLGLGQARVAFAVFCILLLGFTVIRTYRSYQSRHPRGVFGLE